MRKTIFGFILALIFSGQVWAGEVSTTLLVTAQVTSICNVFSETIVFTGYDGSTTVYGRGAIYVQCPTIVPYNVTLSAGQNYDSMFRRLHDGAGNYLSYYLNKPDGGEWGDSGFDGTYSHGSSYSDYGTGGYDTIEVEGILLSESSVSSGVYTDIVNVTVYF